jgi:hypothetical protein
VILKPHVSNMKMWETASIFTGSRPASTRSTDVDLTAWPPAFTSAEDRRELAAIAEAKAQITGVSRKRARKGRGGRP